MNTYIDKIRKMREFPWKGHIPRGPDYQHGDMQRIAYEDGERLIVARLNFDAEGYFYTLHGWHGIGLFGWWGKTLLYSIELRPLLEWRR